MTRSAEVALETVRDPRAVLDIGCATGSFLVHARERGWMVGGTEPVADARAHAARRTGVQIYESLATLPAGKFGVATAVAQSAASGQSVLPSVLKRRRTPVPESIQ